MAATDHLNRHQFRLPETLFHGTNAELHPGDQIRPGHQSNWPGVTEDNGHHVYATGNIAEAYHFGMHAASREGSGNSDYYGALPTPHIYEVTPTGRMTGDPEVPHEDLEYTPSYRSRQPLKVGREVSRGARNEYIAEFGQDWSE